MEEQVDHQNQEEENTLINFLDSLFGLNRFIVQHSSSSGNSFIHSSFLFNKGGAYFATFWLI